MRNRVNDKLKFVGPFFKARLSRDGVLGLHFTLGILLLGMATWLFANLAEEVSAGKPLTVIDARFSNWLHAQATPWLTAAMFVITNMHSTLGVTVMTVGVFAYLWWQGFLRWMANFALTVYGGMLLNLWLKNVFQRARPHFEDPLLSLNTYSFPSGHTMAATVFYGVLVAIVFSRTGAWGWRIAAIVVAALMIALVGFSRIYLGVHYLSDVLGAMVEGAAWLTLCLTALETVRRRRKQRNNQSQ
jgi:undecaprenyl-diphosphatase